MIELDSNNPYPLVSEGSVSYADECGHSEKVDLWLGLRTLETETRIASRHEKLPAPGDQNLWIGLPIQTLLTPYSEIRRILAQISPDVGGRIIDLGAGYGRMGLVIARHYPGVEFIGYEFVAERVEEGQRILFETGAPKDIRLLKADLNASDFSPGPADFYFLYDFGSRPAIEKCLQDLRRIAQTRPIQVIGRGRSSRDAIERHHPWLSQVIPPNHGRHVSLYRSG